MEHNEFITAYRAGHVRVGVDRLKIPQVSDSDVYEHLFDSHRYPRIMNRLSTLFSLMAIPCLVAASVLPFFTSWWAFISCLGLAVIFIALSYRCQKSAVLDLAVVDPDAFTFLSLEGIIVVEKLGHSDENQPV